MATRHRPGSKKKNTARAVREGGMRGRYNDLRVAIASDDWRRRLVIIITNTAQSRDTPALFMHDASAHYASSPARVRTNWRVAALGVIITRWPRKNRAYFAFGTT